MANDMSPARMPTHFDLMNFLEGDSEAWGLFEDRFGRVRRRFHVAIRGSWLDTRFVLDERFTYDDGKTETRTWYLERGTADGSFIGRSEQCIGHARASADATGVHMMYDFRLQLGERTLDVTFDDRIYRMDERVAINRAVVKKWGVTIGAVTLVFLRERQGASWAPRREELAAA